MNILYYDCFSCREWNVDLAAWIEVDGGPEYRYSGLSRLDIDDAGSPGRGKG